MICALSLSLALYSTSVVAPMTSYPNAVAVVKPSPEPPLPASFDSFNPPISAAAVSGSAPVVAEWTRTAQPDTVIALTGSRLSSYTGVELGQDTRFHVFAQNASGSLSADATVSCQDALKAAIVLPATLPADSEYLVWPVNSAGPGTPIAVNATEAWWVGPNAATRGDTVSVYGRNLAFSATSGSSNIYIQKSGSTGIWATVTAANPYKVDFTVPAGLADGTYQVWTHNGHGGHYGWSGPLALTINDGMPWTAQQFNVKTYGAKGDGVTDDQAAIQAAMVAAAKVPWSTVYLPTGTYMVSSGFNPPSQLRWSGDGPTKTFLKANSGFVVPKQDDPRRYCLFFTNGVVSNITIQDLTIDANGNMNGGLPLPVYMRFDSDLRFINVTIKAKGYSIADFHGSNRVSLENCDLIGTNNGIFFGTATQVFIDSCRVYGTNDANTLLTWWGGDGMSCTNTTAQDYDNTQADGWAQGRVFCGSSQWGSNRDIYVGGNTTKALAVRPAFAGQNTGEQLLWENGTKYSAHPTSASATTVTFGSNAFFTDAGLQGGCYDAVVVNGTGLGQHRKIVACNGSTVTIAPAWNVAPDSSSIVLVAGVVSRCAIYGNTLQGKSTYATQVTASAGIQPYGNSYDFIADSNDVSQVCNGIYMWAMNETSLTPQSITCDYFNYVANNNVHECLRGIVGLSNAWGGWPAGNAYPGISFLGNNCVNNTVDSTTEDGMILIPDNAPIGDQLDLNVFAHNLVTNSPVGLDLLADSRLNNTVDYANSLNSGAATASVAEAPVADTAATPTTSGMSTLANPSLAAPSTATPPAEAPSATTPAAVAAAPVVSTPAPDSATPVAMTAAVTTPVSSTGVEASSTTASVATSGSLRSVPTITMHAVAGGAAVRTSFALETPAASVQVPHNAAWLTGVTTDTGSLEVTLTADPAKLSPGTYRTGVMIRSGQERRFYRVVLILDTLTAQR